MHVVSLVWGVLALLGMLVAFLPCLGSLNWLNIPFSLVGLVLSIFALATVPVTKRNAALAGFLCCLAAVLIGAVRLMLGGGVI